MSDNYTKFYIDGAWVAPAVPKLWDVINPATEEVTGQISLGSSADVDKAVAAARRAFPGFSATSREERLALLQRIIDEFEARNDVMAAAMTAEMGSPITFSKEVQTVNALSHFKEMISVLKSYEFERFMGGTLIRREPIGVCGLITPWNWPLNQITSKLAPAIAAGCTVVLKPSEFSPLSAIIFAEALHAAGVPKGVFNLVNGDGPTVGEAISGHPEIDMVSFTGSTRAGILVAKAAATTVKRVTQELGGKSANIILKGADLEKAIPAGVLRCFTNTGQSCHAPDAHAGPPLAAGGRGRARQARGRQRQSRRSARRRDHDGTARQQDAIRQSAGTDRARHPGRRDAGVRRRRPTRRASTGLLRASDRLCRRDP